MLGKEKIEEVGNFVYLRLIRHVKAARKKEKGWPWLSPLCRV